MQRPDIATYRMIAVETYGLPTICAYHSCDDLVEDLRGPGHPFELSGVVHHQDEDQFNNDPANLRVMHAACHIRYHQDDERRLAQAEVARRVWTGRSHSAESREKIAAARRGIRLSDDHRAAISRAVSERNHLLRGKQYEKSECPGCGKILAVHKSGKFFKHVCSQ